MKLSNGLQVSIDWLSWTIKGSLTPQEVIEIIRFSKDDFQLLDKGSNGYRQMYRHCTENIRILFDGAEDMGIHIDVSGSAVGLLMKNFSEEGKTNDEAIKHLLSEIRTYGEFTRIDLAIDDIGENFFSIEEVCSILKEGNCVSHFKKWRLVQEFENGNQNIGSTVYLGSRSSNIMVRVYDKQKEQQSKQVENTEEDAPWVRWEMELKQEYANSVVNRILSCPLVSDVCMAVLSGYMRIIDKDNARKSRCSSSEKWQKFIDSIKGISLYVRPEEKTIEQKRKWLFKQASPSIAMVVQADGGSIDFLYDMVQEGEKRLKPHHMEMIEHALGDDT